MPKKKLPQNIPLPDFLNVEQKLVPRQRKRKLEKHGKAYEAFCKWAALPEELRRPPTQEGFERKWYLPRNYTSYWKTKEDFQAKRLNYFWNNLMDWYPDVVYAIYRRAKRNSSSDAKTFVEIIGKRLDTDEPKTKMLPMMLVGVPQEKIDNLFIPKEYKDIPTSIKKAEEGEVIETEQV